MVVLMPLLVPPAERCHPSNQTHSITRFSILYFVPQAALKRCMETEATPNEGAGRASPSVDGSGLGTSRMQHSGPKGVTGFRGVTQHK